MVEGEWNRRAVAATNDDAAECKLSAVCAGYWEDPALRILLQQTKQQQQQQKKKKPPLINRGHWARVAAVDSALRAFVAAGGRQIVVLGAGSDTAFVRIAAVLREKKSASSAVRWWEIDLPEVVRAKATAIAASPALRSFFLGSDGAVSGGNDGGVVALKTEGYVLASADLNEGPSALEGALADADTALPTLFLSECVLVYLDAAKGDAVIGWAAQRFAQGGVVFAAYEQVRPRDAFGAMMLRNLRERGCSLRSVESFPEPADQIARYRRLGFKHAAAADMNAVTAALIRGDPSTAVWLQRVEALDEFEEWGLIQAHYCLTVAASDGAEFRWPHGDNLPPLSASALARPPLPAAAQYRPFVPLA